MPELNKRGLFASRRHGDEGAVSWRELRGSPTARWTIVGIAAVLLALMLPHSTLVDYHNEVGSIWGGDTVRAPFAFPLYKEESDLQRDRQQAADSVLPTFVPTGVTTGSVGDTLGALARAIAVAEARPGFLSEASWAYIESLPGESR